MSFYCIIYKPFNVLSQFTSQEGKQTLKNIVDVPPDVYAVGRLDYDSEGLLILTNDKKLNQALLHPNQQHKREYWVQVDGSITPEAISRLQNGVSISIDARPNGTAGRGKMYHTKTCVAAVFDTAPAVGERNPPVRFRKNIPTSWIKIILTEGKNRQVRKMTAAVGFPTLRLIRYRVEKCSIEGMMPGDMKLLSQQEIYPLLHLSKR